MLSIAKPMKIKVLLHQFSLLMLNLRYIFLLKCFLRPRHSRHSGNAALYLAQGVRRAQRGKTKKNKKQKNKTQWDLSLRHAFYLVRVVRVADIRVAWLVYVRTYCVPMVTLNQNERSRLHYLDLALIKIRL